MTLTIENILLVGSILLFISIVAGKTSYRFGVPTLLLFLTVGMLAGSDGLGGIKFDDPKVAQFIGIVSLNFILFSGGLDTRWSNVRPILWQGISLSTIGVLFTAVTLGLFVWYVTDFTIYESMLLGSIVSSTDAAAVFSILRSRNLSLRNNLRPTLELESGSNDPMAYVLTISFLTLVVHQDQSLGSVIPLFLRQMLLGAVLGFAFGRVSRLVINRIRLDYEGLYPVLVIALMFVTFSATDFLGGNGFLAIYLCAVYLGNQELIHKKTILRMYDGLAWLMEIVLFVTLGLLVFPTRILPVVGIGLLISAFLILIARPLSVFISLMPFKMRLANRFYISWVGLRGAVPIVFATYPLLAGIAKAEMIFHIVFFISVTSVLIQGTTLSVFARWLGVVRKDDTEPAPLPGVEDDPLDKPKRIMRAFVISSSCPAAGLKIMDTRFPRHAVIALILRDGKYFRPTGATVLAPGDTLYVLSDDESELADVQACLEPLAEIPAGAAADKNGGG